MRLTPRVKKLVERKKGIFLDISLGGVPQPQSIVLGPSGDIAHDPTVLPFPLPSGCVRTAVVTHILEYLPPERVFAWFDELWRVMKPFGDVHMTGPYGGDESLGWLSDPSHRTRILESTFTWLDPRTPVYAMHASVGRRAPKPWYTLALARVPGTESTVSYNVVLQKVEVAK